MDKNVLIACICEGAAEQAIIELLLESDKLYFKKEDLLDDKVIRIRSAQNFEELYLGKYFKYEIIILRILDSRHENFKLRKSYENKVNVINVITAPEIEMLIIHNENKYDDFKKSGEKPSLYCKKYFKQSNIKSYQFVKHYFSDITLLLQSIKQYHNKANIHKKEVTLYDLLKHKDSL